METDLKLFGYIAVAALFGYMIGWEREFRGSKAGNRTFALVAIGSSAFAALSVEYFPASAEKVIAGIITGVGFLGAGLIFKSNEGGVFGLTTAAALWAVAAQATLVGAGRIALGAFTTLMVIFVLELEYMPLLSRLDAVSHGRQKKIEHEET